MPEGDPDPVVTWQRRVAGFWQTIGADDDDFTLAGGTLTVKDTNVDQSGALFRAKVSNAVATVYSKTAKLTVSAGTGIPPEGLSLDDVTLDWTGSPELQKAPPFGGSNYFSAGVSDGTEATYATTVRPRRRRAGRAERRRLDPDVGHARRPCRERRHASASASPAVRPRSPPTAPPRCAWSGSFSVNFYGGLVPFTITRPRADGRRGRRGHADGRPLRLRLQPGEPGLAHAGRPRRRRDGRDVLRRARSTLPARSRSTRTTRASRSRCPSAPPAQNRTVEGWGAWPQPFVDFHVATGLAPYWYSSGGAADAFKAPDPFVVDFTGSKQGGPAAPARRRRARPARRRGELRDDPDPRPLPPRLRRSHDGHREGHRPRRARCRQRQAARRRQDDQPRPRRRLGQGDAARGPRARPPPGGRQLSRQRSHAAVLGGHDANRLQGPPQALAPGASIPRSVSPSAAGCASSRRSPVDRGSRRSGSS